MSAMKAPRRIAFTVGTEGESTQLAWEWATKHVFMPEDEILLVHVFPAQIGERTLLQRTDEETGQVASIVKRVIEQPFQTTTTTWLLKEMRDAQTRYPKMSAVELFDKRGISDSILSFLGELADTGRPVDLTIIGSRDRQMITSFFMGSVSSDVVHSTAYPVIIVRRSAASHHLELQPEAHTGTPAAEGGSLRRTVLIAVDGSQASPNLVAWAMRHALQPQDKVILVSSMEGAPDLGGGFKEEGKTLDVCKDALLAAGFDSSVLMLDNKTDVRDALVDFVEVYKPPVDLMVMGSRTKKAALRRRALGGTASYCVKYVQCPVLVVPKDLYCEEKPLSEEEVKKVKEAAGGGQKAAIAPGAEAAQKVPQRAHEGAAAEPVSGARSTVTTTHE